MTDQIPDTCTFDGCRWEIVSCEGNHCECMPTNDELGIKTVAPHTANWAGRINHFLVLGHQLYLAKIEVTLDTEQDTKPLERFRREVVTRYEPMQCFDAEGEQEVINEYRSDYIFFDDVAIPFTGSAKRGQSIKRKIENN